MGSKTQTSTSESKPWEPAIGHLENILNNAGNLFDSQGGINAEWIDKELADLTPEMQDTVKNLINSQGFKDLATNIGTMTQQGMSGIGQATGVLGGLTQQGITSDQINKMAKDFYDSEMVQSQKETLGKDIQKGLDKSVQGINQRAAGSGSMGSSRAGVAEGVAIGEASDAYASGAANIENQARKDAMSQAIGTLQGNQSTALGAAGQLGQLGLGSGQLQAGLGDMYQNILNNQLTGSGILQDQAQNVLNNKWFNQQGQQNMGWDMLNKYLGVAGSIGGMGGTTTNTGKGQSGLQQAVGMGSTIMGGLGMMGFSDTSMKTNVKRTGRKTKTGEPEYTWTWNEEGKKAGKKGKGRGVLAQQVQKTNPDAVQPNAKNGMLMVDYSKV